MMSQIGQFFATPKEEISKSCTIMRAFAWLILSICVTCTFASAGEKDNRYRHCYFPCLRGCAPEYMEYYSLKLGWSCEDHCRYICMHQITTLREELGEPVVQYNGRWPFYRFYGIENPASAIFSVANAIPHLLALFSLRSLTSDRYFMSPWLRFYPVVGVNAWVCSTVFHARETAFTTNLDYISALLLLSYGLILCIRRMFGRLDNSGISPHIVNAGLVLVMALTVAQIIRMIQGKVTYDLHMQVCIVLASAHTLGWVVWFFRNKHRKYAFSCIVLQLCFAAAAMLELFDFPPYFRLFDAHAIWHLATIPIGFYWYQFWREDMKYEAAAVVEKEDKTQ